MENEVNRESSELHAQLNQALLELWAQSARLDRIERHLGLISQSSEVAPNVPGVSVPPQAVSSQQVPSQVTPQGPSHTLSPQSLPPQLTPAQSAPPQPSPALPRYPSPAPIVDPPVRGPVPPATPVAAPRQSPRGQAPLLYTDRSRVGGVSLVDRSAPPVPAPVPHVATGTSSTSPDGGESRTIDWENLIGGKWALWVGSVAVFLALAFFLAYTWTYLPPVARMAIGFTAGSICLAGGYLARDRGESWFSEGLSGAGLGLGYLTIWAGMQHYHLLSFEMAFALMAVITAIGVGLSVHYDALSLIVLSTMGGFLTPALLDTPGRAAGASLAMALPFMTYVSVLNVGILVVSLFKRWNAIVWLSFIATLLLVLGWTASSYTTALRWPTFLFLTLLFQIYLATACFYSLIRKEKTADNDLLLMCSDAFVYGLAGYALISDALGDYRGTLAFLLALAFVGLYLVSREVAAQNISLRLTAGGIALFYLTIAVPIQFRQYWVSIGWSVEAAVLFTLGSRLSSSLLRGSGLIVWVLSLLPLLSLVVSELAFGSGPSVDKSALPLLISALATAWMSWIDNKTSSDAASDVNDGGAATVSVGSNEPLSWAGLFALWAVGGGAWLIWREASSAFGGIQWPSPTTWQAGALFVTACLWAMYALAIFVLGCVLRHSMFRLCALLVLALTVALILWTGSNASTEAWAPFWNLRSLAYLTAVLTLIVLHWLLGLHQERPAATDEGQPRASDTAAMREALPVIVSLLALWGLTEEVYAGFDFYQFPDVSSWQPAAAFAVAALWNIGAVLLLLRSFTRQQGLLRACAYVVAGLGVVLLLATASGSSTEPASQLAVQHWTPVINARFIAGTVISALLLADIFILQRRKAALYAAELSLPTPLALLTASLIFWGLTQETYAIFRFYEATFGSAWERWAQMAVSLMWTVGGAALLVGGIHWSYRPIRLAALGLLSLTVLKVFLYDLGFLDAPLRILSFGGLGLALIFISWLYSRYGTEHHPGGGTKTGPDSDSRGGATPSTPAGTLAGGRT